MTQIQNSTCLISQQFKQYIGQHLNQLAELQGCKVLRGKMDQRL
jgi:hypothetical protein